MRIFRLAVTLPPGSEEPGWAPPGWEHPAAAPFDDEPRGFSWPRQRTYMSPTTARKAAARLERFGAKVEVYRSKRIEWEPQAL